VWALAGDIAGEVVLSDPGCETGLGSDRMLAACVVREGGSLERPEVIEGSDCEAVPKDPDFGAEVGSDRVLTACMVTEGGTLERPEGAQCRLLDMLGLLSRSHDLSFLECMVST